MVTVSFMNQSEHKPCINVKNGYPQIWKNIYIHTNIVINVGKHIVSIYHSLFLLGEFLVKNGGK